MNEDKDDKDRIFIRLELRDEHLTRFFWLKHYYGVDNNADVLRLIIRELEKQLNKNKEE